MEGSEGPKEPHEEQSRREQDKRVDDSIANFEKQFRAQTATERAMQNEIDDLSDTVRYLQTRMNDMTTATETPLTEEQQNEQTSQKQREEAADHAKKAANEAGKAAEDGARASGNFIKRSYRKVGPTTVKEWGLSVGMYALGFWSGGRFATSEWLEQQMERTGQTGA